MSNVFQIATLTPGLLQPSIAVATQRAGGLAILDFEYTYDCAAVAESIRRFNDAVREPFGIKLSGDSPELLSHLIADFPNQLQTIVLTSACPLALREHILVLRNKKITTLLEVTCLENAKSGEIIGVDGLIAKGHEAGGRIADETTFILLQRLQGEVSLPLWAHGGIGLHTAAACVAAGAAGVILDAQLALTRESPFADAVKSKIASMDGSETICLGSPLGETYRIHFRPGNPIVKKLQEIEARLADDERASEVLRAEWRQAVTKLAGWESEKNALMLGQDASFAASLAERFRTVGGVLQGIRDAVRTHCEAAIRLRPLAEGAPLARANGTRYPILQGPMTRVSDVPEFAARVSEGGALPFLALALMRGPEVKAMLAEAQRRMGALPWGVGILGFVPPELRQEQMDVIGEYHPPFALIAGGRPDHARELEQKGIPTYLHVPSPGLLKMFVQQGARRFVFEGRECGGHVGPRTSFVLWNQMVDVLLEASEGAKAEEFHIVFAAGIHDALSASMVSVIAAPLAERGMRIGVLLGTAYLFTEEAVAAGAISATFQEQARSCHNTVLLETGPGHSTRCVDTPFATSFAQEKRRLWKEGRPADEIRMALEELNLGRLRIASKGVTRHPKFGQDPAAPRLLEIEKSEQLAQGMYMIGQVAALRHTTCTVEALHRDVAVEGSKKLASLKERFRQTQATPGVESPSDVAIIGMSCLLPKAPDVLTYWENILNKVNAVGEIPKDRWNWELYFDSDPKTRDKIYSKWGGFLDEVEFDPMTFGMPPASLRSIEPAQLLTLEVVRAALTDAGYLGRPFPRERTSVILGAGGGAADLGLAYGARSFIPMLENLPEFQGRSQEILDRLDKQLPEWTEDSFAGILTNVAAGRVANRFDLGGSNYTVDAACASSLAAVSQALKELEGRTSDMVIVGGMDTMQNPFTYLCFSKTHALSPRGRCRTFDEGADGIAISEGIAIMVFKRLADAERDGDRIYAVIKAAGSSSDGKDRGLTAPRPEGQAKALRRAYAKAGISPATVGLVEAHGTGTVAGDGAEVQALTEVFSEAEASRQGCAIGSVKSMIGHTKCTAGAAGLVKAALALHHKVLPPTLGVEKPNPRAHFPETPFFVNTEPRPWLASPDGHPRRAGVSAFGFGGTNFHIVLEEYTGDPFSKRPAAFQNWPEELFLWRADSRTTLRSNLESWVKSLATDAKPALRDLAYTAWKQAESTTTEKGSLQLAIVASSLDDLKQKLDWALQGLSLQDAIRINDPRGIYFTERPLASEGKLAFLFSGQGSQYPRMFEDLLVLFPEMQEVVEEAVRVLGEKLPQSLSAYIFPPPSFSREEEKQRQQALTQTNVAQPALGAVGLAMFKLLQELGLQPEMAAGHSYGEYVALAAAGVFNTETLIALSEARGRFIVEGAGAESGVMAAIEADATAVGNVLKNFEGVCLANANAPRQSVISGTRSGVERVVAHFAAQGTTAKMIPVACAFHSPLVAPAQARLREFLSTVEAAQPTITVYSNTTAAPYPRESKAVAERLVDHLVRPVEFVREIESMYETGARVFVEVGPRGVLTSLVDQILGDRPKLAVASNQNGRPGVTQLLHLLGQLSAQGYALKLERLYRGRTNRQLDLGALPRECAEKKPSASAWMVNGAHARPLKEIPTQNARPKVTSVPAPAPATQPVQNTFAATTASRVVTETFHTKKGTNGTTLFQSPTAPPSAPATIAAGMYNNISTSTPASSISAASPADSAGVPEVMTQFQQVMGRFLETQKVLMLSYLGGHPETAAAPAIAPPAYEAVPMASAPAVSYPSTPSTNFEPFTPAQRDNPPEMASVPVAAPPVIATPVSAGPNSKELTAQLLAIVSDRTGYPPEMLDLNLDLEADLGIDSIKRVEILGTFQQTFVASGLSVEEGLMEKLTGVRTLQGIVERIMDQFGAGVAEVSRAPLPAAAEPQIQPPPQARPAFDKQALITQLLSIVSDRTGYPPEMLDLNLDLEADLGIDSIKRVEILGTFQQVFVASGMSVEEGLMEKLTGVRTLQGIIDRLLEDRVFEQVGSEVAAVSAAPVPAAGHAIEHATGTVQKPAFDKKALTAQLLSIVSERTGYPPEMLDLNLDLEADLGIDSIKRVEILGTFQQSFVAGGMTVEEGLMEKLTGVRTLQGIMDRLFEQVTVTPESKRAEAPTEVPAKQQADPDESTSSHNADAIRRFTLAVTDAPFTHRSNGIAKNRTILITDGGHVVVGALAEALIGQGYKVAVVRQGGRQGEAVQELDAGIYAADLGSSESVTELIALVTQRQGPLGGIVHLLGLQGQGSFAAHDHKGWKRQLQFSAKTLFHIAKAAGKHLGEAAAESGASLIAATGMGGTFLSDLPADAEATFPDHGAIAGLVKTLALEWPAVSVKVVDLNLKESGPALARHLADELNGGNEHVEVGYDGDRRITLRPTYSPLHGGTPMGLALDSSSVVLITGGARGITALAAKRLAELYKPTLVLAGRSPLPPAEESAETSGISTPRELKAALMNQMRGRGETVTPALVERAYSRLMGEREIRGNLTDLRELGAQVFYFPIDVRNADAFGSFIDEVYSSFGRLDGVIHGAGVIEDKLVRDKTPESFDRVFDTKVDSAFVLSRKLRSESLKFLVFFSSVSGRFGNRGQGDYAAANEVLNKVSVCLDRAWPGRVVAINWGPWDTDGMVSAEVRKQFAERGVELILPAVGLDRLEEELSFGRRGEAEVVIGGAGWQPAINQSVPRRIWPLLGQAVSLGKNGHRELIREINPVYDLYLLDHQLDGQPVLPLAMATELMAEAVAQGWPELQVVGVRDLRLFQGIVVEGGSKTVRVVAKAKAGSGPAPASVTVEVIGTGQPQRIHYRATVDLAERLPNAPSFHLEPLSDGVQFHMNVGEIYDRWLFHGPLFHGITSVDLVGAGGVKAMLATTSPAGWIDGESAGQWLIDPLMFDSALQILVLWARENWDMTALPSGFQSYRRFAAPSASSIVCEMRIRPETGGQTIHADIFFLDAATGQVVSILEDMQGACSKALNRLSERKVLAASAQQ